MKFDIDGRQYDTEDMLDMNVGPIRSWLGGQIHLVGLWADREGLLYILQDSDHVDERTGQRVGIVAAVANRKLVRYLVERFELPAAYIKAAPAAPAEDL